MLRAWRGSNEHRVGQRYRGRRAAWREQTREWPGRRPGRPVVVGAEHALRWFVAGTGPEGAHPLQNQPVPRPRCTLFDAYEKRVREAGQRLSQGGD